MNSKNLLSTLLYALIGLLLIVIGYKACQVQKAKAEKLAEDAKFNQQLADMGITESDVKEGASAYVSGTEGTKPATYPDGAIEGETTTPVTNSSATKTSGSIETDEEGRKVSVTDLDAESGMTEKPKYLVIAGSFRKLANARQSMEALVKKGYIDAEVGKFNRGAYACAIAKRTNNLKEARAIAVKLRAGNFPDAFVKVRK